MNTQDKFVITINRELGSGGRTVGAILARKLNVPYYDKLLIQALEKKYQLDIEEIERLKGQKKSWWEDFARMVKPFVDASQENFLMHTIGEEVGEGAATPENVFKAEKEILHGIADAGSSIIAGRSAFYVLKDHPNKLSVLIQAPLEQRIARVMEKQKLPRQKAIETIERVDKMRENYVQRFTGTSRYDTRNYDIVINMNGLSEEEAADLILKYIKI